MAGGEDILFPYLNARLLNKPSPVSDAKLLRELNSDSFPVPRGPKELQASQNLFWLKAGAERERFPNKLQRKDTDQQLIDRIKREANTIGLWGSEQTSPIYHHFILTGQIATWLNTNNAELKLLIQEELVSFMTHSINMGMDSSLHGFVGQRGTGHDLATKGFPYLHFASSYFIEGLPLNFQGGTVGGWKTMLRDSGWVMSMLPSGRARDLWQIARVLWQSPQFASPHPLMVPLHMFRDNNGLVGHYIERGTNGNTPELGGYLRGNKYLPVNSQVRIRQKASHGVYSHAYSDGKLSLSYTGIYTDKPDSTGNPQVISVSVNGPLYHRMMGIDVLNRDSGWVTMAGHVAEEPGQNPATPGQKPSNKPSWIERMGV